MDVREEVLQVAHEYLRKVKRSGPDNIMAVCPFHLKPDGSEERTPSFTMSLSRGVYFCHSCHEKGNLFTFLRDIGLPRSQIENRYRGLLDEAARTQPDPPDPLRTKIWDVDPVNEGVLGLLDMCPIDLLKAGFTEETLYHFEVGYDRWHYRITFPLRDIKGSLVGIMGRAVTTQQEPRFKVYTKEYRLWHLPERKEPDKRCLLWNAHRVYPAAYFKNPSETSIVVVEGFKAAMWLWQAGIKNVVALMGSYMSWEHGWIIERIGAPVTLFLDNDFAGRSGTTYAADCLSKSLNVRVAMYPKRLAYNSRAQPNDCTPEEAVEAVGSAIPNLTRQIERG